MALISNAQLAIFIVATGIHRSGIGKKHRVIITASRLNDVQFFQSFDQLRNIERCERLMATLTMLIASKTEGLVVLSN